MFDDMFPGIIDRYLIFVEKDPQWEDILLLIRILRDQRDAGLSNKLKDCLINCFNKYFKIPFCDVKGFI